jgi:hypothetical protein
MACGLSFKKQTIGAMGAWLFAHSSSHGRLVLIVRNRVDFNVSHISILTKVSAVEVHSVNSEHNLVTW